MLNQKAIEEFTKGDIEGLITEICILAKYSLINGHTAKIEGLKIDILIPPKDFLGVDNPAIFVTEQSYAFLKRFHPHWEVNKTIAMKKRFLDKASKNKASKMMLIGALVHEVGHAFNIATGLANTEGNAYIFEIEVLSAWAATNHPSLHGCTGEDVHAYLMARMDYFSKSINTCHQLQRLREIIKTNDILGRLDWPLPIQFYLSQTTDAQIGRMLSSHQAFFGNVNQGQAYDNPSANIDPSTNIGNALVYA